MSKYYVLNAAAAAGEWLGIVISKGAESLSLAVDECRRLLEKGSHTKLKIAETDNDLPSATGVMRSDIRRVFNSNGTPEE